MSRPESIDVIQLGLSGVVADRFRQSAGDPRSPLHLVAIAAAQDSNKLIGKKLGQTGLEHPTTLDYVPIVSLDDVPEIEAPVIFSGLRTEEAEHREIELVDSRLLVTNASANRMRPYAALFNAYVGGGQLDEVFGKSVPGHIVAGGNCAAIPISMVAAPIHRALGITSVKVETLQGWSGRGDTEVPAGSEGECPPILGDEAQKIKEEPPKFLGSMEEPAPFEVTEAKPQRGPWVYGHHVRVEMRTEKTATKDEVIELLEDVRAPEELDGFRYKHGPRKRPLRLSRKPLLEGGGDTLHIRRKPKPMRADVHVKRVKNEGHTIRVEIVGDNLVLGAAGSNVMNIMYARAKGYI